MYQYQQFAILLRGGGDIATGIALRLYRSGFRRLIILETAHPMAVRRRVAFSEAVYEGLCTVEGITAALAPRPEEIAPLWDAGCIPVMVDPQGVTIPRLRPEVVIEATLAKRNVGVGITDAPLVIGVGPGFTAGEDCHAAVETMRGHTLGRVIYCGSPIPNTGVPGIIGGYGAKRVMRSPAAGVFEPKMEIGQMVKAGEVAAVVNGQPMLCTIDGCLRGLLQEGLTVPAGMKCGDIDPRCQQSHCFQASDKALAVGGGVLEALLHFGCRPD